MSEITLVLDIETVPDYEVWSPPQDEPEADPDKCEKCGEALSQADSESGARKCPKMQRGKCRLPKAKAAAEPPFPPLYAHRICVIGGCMLGDNVPSPVFALTAETRAEEPVLLAAFNDFMVKNNPTLVTWNGLGFDVPVIDLRGFRHAVPQTWLSRDHGPYGDRHIDLKARLGHNRADTLREFSLDKMARMIGLPGKGAMDGSMVADVMREPGGIERVAEYCAGDVRDTTALYLRWCHVRGKLTADAYAAALGALA